MENGHQTSWLWFTIWSLPVTNNELWGEPEWVTPPIALLPVWMKWGLSLNSTTHANKAHTEQCLGRKNKNCSYNLLYWLKEVSAHCPFRYYIHKLQENSLKADSNVLEVDSIFPSQDSVTITAESNNQNPSEFRAGHKNLWGFRLKHLLGVGNKLKTLPEFLLFM